jgi:hypothetical protein
VPFARNLRRVQLPSICVNYILPNRKIKDAWYATYEGESVYLKDEQAQLLMAKQGDINHNTLCISRFYRIRLVP